MSSSECPRSQADGDNLGPMSWAAAFRYCRQPTMSWAVLADGAEARVRPTFVPWRPRGVSERPEPAITEIPPKSGSPLVDLCCEIVTCIFIMLPTRDKCAMMTTCRYFYESPVLRPLIATAKRIYCCTASRQMRYKKGKHQSKHRRDAHKKQLMTMYGAAAATD